MAGEVATAYVNVAISGRGIHAQLDREFGRPLAQMGEKAGRDAGDKAGRSFAERFSASSQKLEAFGKTAIVASAALGAGLFKAAGAAGNLEAAIAANVQVLGDASESVLSWAEDSVEAVGLSERAAIEAATSFGQLGKIIGLTGEPLADFSTQMVSAAADMAAFKDVPVDQALADLQAGFAGQTEVLRKYGIFLDDVSLKQAYFRETGEEVSGTLTAQQRIIATQSEIMRQGADMWGQWDREASSLAATQSKLKAEFENAAASIGKSFLPAVTGIVSAAGKGIGALGRLNDATGGMVGTLAGVGTVALGAAGGLAFVASKASDVMTKLREMSTVGRVGMAGLGLAIVAFAVEADRASGHAERFAGFLGEIGRASDREAAALLGIEVAFQKLARGGKSFEEVLADVARAQPGVIARYIEMEEASGLVSNAIVGTNASAEEQAEVMAALEAALITEREAQEQQALTTAAGAEAMGDAAGMSAELAALMGDLGLEIDGATESTSGLAAGLETVGGWFGATEESSSSFGGALQSVTGWFEGMSDVAASTIEVMSDADRAFEAATAEADAFGSALDRLVNGADLQAAGDQIAATLIEIQSAIDDGKTSLDQHTDAGLANRAMIRGGVSDILAYGEANLEAGYSVEETAGAMALMREQLINQVTPFFETREAAAEYIDTLGLTPENITTAVDLANDEVMKGEIEAVITKLGEIPESEMTSIQALIDEGQYAAALRRLQELARARTATIWVAVRSSGGNLSNAGKGMELATATGGYFDQPEVRLIGEAGAEWVAPLTRPALMKQWLKNPSILGPVLSALPRIDTAASSSRGGGTVVWNQNAPVYGVDDLQRAIGNAFRAQQDRQLAGSRF